jgi:hypothetical protein
VKCVRVVGQGLPHRLTDTFAAELVAEGDAEYCPKIDWKLFHDNNADPAWRERRVYTGGTECLK